MVEIKNTDRLITFFDDDPCNTDIKLETEPIKALRGCSQNINLTGKLLESRREDSEIEGIKM
ncbi:MAG: hypothetical protein GY749_43865 [Desulfobacteraceae bacterium]|nr:hypothetical protein [Desulfobacteraceae bacterium]